MACYHSERSPVKLTYRLNDHGVHLVRTELELVARETGERMKDSGSVTWSVTWQSYQSVMITWSVTWHIIIDQSHYIIWNYMIRNTIITLIVSRVMITWSLHDDHMLTCETAPEPSLSFPTAADLNTTCIYIYQPHIILPVWKKHSTRQHSFHNSMCQRGITAKAKT